MIEPQVAALGEILVRLATSDKKLLRTATSLDVTVAGAEANVIAALSSLGHSTRMISRLPDGDLGELARGTLRMAGIDCRHIATAEGRMGLYFLTPGAGLRASDILYDRADSVFALAGSDDFEWDDCLAGITHLHLSGVTPALGPRSAQLALHAAHQAKKRGIVVVFDGNYRASLWNKWDSNPRNILNQLVGSADIFFGNHRDVSLLLDRQFDGDGADRRRHAAEAIMTAFPNLTLVASTARTVVDANHNRISVRVDTPDQCHQTNEVQLNTIVDRIGAGDAFAAGILHGMLTGADLKRTAHYGLALTCLKHSIPGDFALVTRKNLEEFTIDASDVKR